MTSFNKKTAIFHFDLCLHIRSNKSLAGTHHENLWTLILPKKKVMTVEVVFHTNENVCIRPLKEKYPSVSSVRPVTLTSRMLSSCFGHNIVILGVYDHMTLKQDGQEQEQICPKRAERSKIQRLQVWCGCSDDAGRVTHTKFILSHVVYKKF